MSDSSKPLVGVMMGSKSDWETMRSCHEMLAKFGIPHVCRVLSAHRTPKEAAEFVKNSEADGTEVFIAAAGGAAHLAGAVAAHTVLPVIGVPMSGWAVQGLDALLSTVQMPPGMPVATVAIGKPGAINAALLAVSILGVKRPELLAKLREYRATQAEKILAEELV
jgi:5-(carboxyamino)imidazole ribonucleotide mutase